MSVDEIKSKNLETASFTSVLISDQILSYLRNVWVVNVLICDVSPLC